MEHDIIATEPDGFNWLATGTIWDRNPKVYRAVATAAAQIRWHSVTERTNAAASRRLLALDFFESGLIAATGASEPTLWLPRAKPYRTKPVPFTLTGIREVTAAGTRALLLLTDDRGTVPIALTERPFDASDADSPYNAGHDHCFGRDADGRTCPCRCGYRWPDRLTVYQRLVVGDEATDPAWQWSFTVTGAPEETEHGNLALEVQGRDERAPDLLCRGPDEPVIVHNAWRPDRTGATASEPPPST
jgi:hypothetical protein